MRLLILGGTRFLGLHFLKLMAGSGYDITLFNRGTKPNSLLPTSIRVIHGNRNNPKDIEILKKQKFDAAVDFSGYSRPQAELIIEQFADNIDHYVYCSTAAVYEETDLFPFTEESPLGKWPVWGDYGKGKLESELAFWNAHSARDFPLTVIRPVYILGPANYLDRESFIISRLINDSPVLIPGDGQALIQFVFVDEVAKAIKLILENASHHIGEAYNCSGNEFTTLHGLVKMFANYLNKEAKVANIELEKWRISSVPYEAEDIFPFSNTNFICSNRKTCDALGLEFRSLTEGIEELFHYYVNIWAGKSFKHYPREEYIIAQLDL